MAAITLESIPPLSAIVLHVMQFDPEKPDSDVQTLERIVQADKGISARLLKVANSSFYGRSGKIKTVREAITLLGLKAAKNLIVMMGTQSLAAQLKDPTYRTFLQEYPVLCALVALDLCGPAGKRPLAEQSFLCALLASIGMTVIALNRPDHYSVLLTTARTNKKMQLISLEQESYRTDHCKVGLLVCEAWKLPADFAEVMASRKRGLSDLKQTSDLVRLCMLADTVVRRLLVIPHPHGHADAEADLAASVGIAPDKLAAFDADYYEGLKEHPFHAQAMGS